MKRPPGPYWVVCAGDGFLCRRCGSTQKANAPMGLDHFLALVNAFLETHASCEEVLYPVPEEEGSS